MYKDRKLNRLKNYNYSKNGYYFITICVLNCIEWFGRVENEKMILNECGRIADYYWKQIPKHYKYVYIDKFVVMPNHIHGIIIINDPNQKNKHIVGAKQYDIIKRPVGTEHCSVPTVPTHVPITAGSVPTINKKYGLISKIIKSYKNTCTNKMRQIPGFKLFIWQRSFHDRIIRNKYELFRKRNYIQNNPQKWFRDRNNKNNLWM